MRVQEIDSLGSPKKFYELLFHAFEQRNHYGRDDARRSAASDWRAAGKAHQVHAGRGDMEEEQGVRLSYFSHLLIFTLCAGVQVLLAVCEDVVRISSRRQDMRGDRRA